MATFKILGTTQNVETCECCGRTGLKKTVELGILDADGAFHGEVTHYGTDCAASALKTTATKIENKLTNLAHEFRGEATKNELLGRFLKQASNNLAMGNAEAFAKSLARICALGAVTANTVKAAYGW